MLEKNPDLTWDQVKKILKTTCKKIDRTQARYNAKGHSKLLGYGRVHARDAVKMAGSTT
jgi:hypothetical protein